MLIREPEETISETSTARLPAAKRVAGILLERINSGLYATGQMLPTERVLSDDLRVHRRVVRAAIEHMVADGLVYRRPHCRPTIGQAPREAASNGRSGAARISASNLIALIMWHGGGPLEHTGTSQQRIFWGMNQVLTAAGYHAVFLDLGGHIGNEEENAAREAGHLRYVMDQGFGGVVFYPYAYRHNRELVREVCRSLPLVMLDRRIPGVDVDFVGIENHDAMFEITRYLIGKGHRRIAYVTKWESIDSVQDRVHGYLDAVNSAKEHDIVDAILTCPSTGKSGAWTVTDAVFRLPCGQRPTAAVCFTDYTAVALAKRLEELGLDVPGDVELTGFDDIVPALPNGIGLTTVAQPYEEIGSAAVELLMRRIKDRSAAISTVKLPARLVVRASTPDTGGTPKT